MRKLTHIESGGRARMVDVSKKSETRRTAVATGRLRMNPATLEHILSGKNTKGSVTTTAEIAGVMAAKRTADLIPLCHALPQVNARVVVEADPALPGLQARAEVTVAAATGVEMEALAAVSVALLTAYDMAKAVDRGMEIERVRLERKQGGRSGVWER
ncbi:MAG: cyclic pyranopterin monophosphate synthase MoaC [Gemmatimonadetes bacterium]|nr:cyclic pyranopterin monophosphate synthase MoaC [Gemmatimonadota bacterium]